MSKDNNNTLIFGSPWNNTKSEIPFNGGCMSAVKQTTGKVSIIIPYKELHNDLRKEDVESWVKLGNKTIFPAVMEEKYVNLSINTYNLTKVKNTLLKEEFSLIEKEQYYRSDSNYVKTCTINNISSNTNINVIIVKSRNSSYGSKGENWSTDSRDFQDKNGVSVYDRIQSEIKKITSDIDTTKANSYVITFDADKCYSNHHKLALLSFYRYLWSYYYKNLVKNTLKIVDLDVDPWEALMLELSRGDYYYYFSLTTNIFRGIPKMDTVVTEFRRGNNINNSFFNSTINISDHRFTKINKESIKTALFNYKEGAIIPTKVKCINPTPYLTKYKVYKIQSNDSSCYQINGYNNKWFSKSRFEKVKI